VVNVGGVTPVTSTTWGSITGTLSSQVDLQTALDLKAPLASPTFTGTPTLPTGTIATTQTAGNNTTAVATTAFVRTDNNVKAWVNFNGTGTVAIRASFNVSSITDNGTGDYTVNFTNALADANYSMSAFCGQASFTLLTWVSSYGTYTQTATAFRLKCGYSSNPAVTALVDTQNVLATFIR
jgi:hypothetical protein